MRLVTKQFWVLLIVFLLLLGLILAEFSRIRNNTYHRSLLIITGTLELYIQENKGNFPENEEALVKSDLLKRQQDERGIRISLRRRRGTDEFSGSWRLCGNFDDFIIRYGTSLSDLSVLKERLVLSDTQEPVFLIRGPRIKKKTLTLINMRLYGVMKNSREQKE